MPHRFGISDVAARAGVTADTLRYCERLGILPRARRTTGGLRRYGDDVLRQLQFIQQAKAMGMTIKDVRLLVKEQGGKNGGDRCRTVRDLLIVRRLRTGAAAGRSLVSRNRRTAAAVAVRMPVAGGPPVGAPAVAMVSESA